MMNLPVELVAQKISAEDTPDSDFGGSNLNAVNYSFFRCRSPAREPLPGQRGRRVLTAEPHWYNVARWLCICKSFPGDIRLRMGKKSQYEPGFSAESGMNGHAYHSGKNKAREPQNSRA